MSKVLVTGGAGFIGMAVARKLLAEGHEVATFDIKEPRERITTHYMGTIMYVDELQKILKNYDSVVHLAAMLGVERTETNRLGCLDINIQGSRNVFEACAKANIQKIIYASSSEVYGEPLTNPITEEHPLIAKTVYGTTKIAGEEYIKAYHQEYGMDYSIIRFFNAYGPGQGPDWVMPRFIQSVMKGEQPTVYGSGEQERCFCHVDDSAQGVHLALTRGEASKEAFNIGNDTTKITMAELARLVIKISGKELEPRFVTMENSDRTEEREIKKRIADISKARGVLGFEPTVTLEEGIRDIMEKDFGVESRA